MYTIQVFLNEPDIQCFTFTGRHKKKLERLCPNAQVRVSHTEDDFLKGLKDADIAVSWYFKEEWFHYAPRLHKLVTPAAGLDLLSIDPPEGVKVENSSFHGPIIAETVVGMILAHTRRITEAYHLQQTDPWPRGRIGNSAKPLYNSHVAILGFGSIGWWVGKLLKAFNVRITGIKRNIIEEPDYFDAEDKIQTVSELDEIIPEVDHLVLILPKTKETDNIIGKNQLAALPSHAGIYNVGRGNAIDELALYAALANGDISAAYLDVFREEPLSGDSPLRTLANCCIMPHTAATAPEYLDLFVEEFAAKQQFTFD